jgi:hypothetical protein
VRLLLILLSSQLFFLNPAFGATGGTDFESVNIYIAAGQNFYFPASFRVGWNGWEGGTLSKGFFGLNKLFPLSGGSVYSSFGFGVNADGYTSNLGFRSGVGVNYRILWGLGLRMEMFALANFNGQFTSHGLLGFSYVF